MTLDGKFIVKDNLLLAGATTIQVGSPLWYDWVASAKKFSFVSQNGRFVAQREMRRNHSYWYAYRRRSGKLVKIYLGKQYELTPERLEQACLALEEPNLLKQFSGKTGEQKNLDAGPRIDTSFLPMAKINAPLLPHQLVTRSRLLAEINTPITLIYAPSGFGKSTLANDWKQTCGFPVAWLSLDENDNFAARFWYSIVMAFQVIYRDFGKELLSYLSSSAIDPAEAALRLTNDVIHAQAVYPRLGLILDEFDHIRSSEVYDSLQAWLERLPSNVQLVILGHTKPPLSLGHLRAKCLLTELDTNDLRFTMEEGLRYLRQYPQDPLLAYDDLEKLIKHTEGWAAGLTLTALALGKQEDRRHFIDTFSGAHIYLREYFMETVLQRSSPEIQSFLLKTAILKQLTGSLCDAITGQTNGEEILAQLWQENLFIIRLEEQGWYRYHHLFAEMLYSQLQTRFPDEVPQLHQRAARWYREQYATAEAIYHLMAIEAWEEAALLLEEMALHELEELGEDSRLLRWLQELPEIVFQKHKNLLFVYLRLANIALPPKKVERFLDQIEKNISGQSAALRTQDENDVLAEIQQIRHTWAQGSVFTPPARAGNDYDVRWGPINRLPLLRPAYLHNQNSLNEQLMLDLLHSAQEQNNLFVILMAGGTLSRWLANSGQLRRSEKLCRQILEQAILQRGKLPEPASIPLIVLSHVYLERNEIKLAEECLNRVAEVDPNPASTNIFVYTAFLRAKIQAARGQMEESRTTIQAIRRLHLRRPSGLWTDLELLIYEAFICLRNGDDRAAEQIMVDNESAESLELPLYRLVQAEIALRKRQFEVAEKLFSELILANPNGIAYEPLMLARVLLALALFGQNKIHRALQVITDAIRLAAPERFIRPFLDHSVECVALLWLCSQNDDLTREAKAFIEDLLRLLDPTGKRSPASKAEMEKLTTSALISTREQEVLALLSSGYTNGEIANELSISESTVKTHLGHIYHKFNVNSRVQAVTQARELGLVS